MAYKFVLEYETNNSSKAQLIARAIKYLIQALAPYKRSSDKIKVTDYRGQNYEF